MPAIRPDIEPAPPPPTIQLPEGPISQPGCVPQAPRKVGPATPKPPPSYLKIVPEAHVPDPIPPATPRTNDLSAVSGKGMWIWLYGKTEAGNATAIVDRALAAGLSTLWVRVGSSKDGFYGAAVLEQLVPLAHERGLRVVGWGFPYLADPNFDAYWSHQALDWSFNGHRLDAFSPDIETGSEGVVITPKRAAYYLSLVRARMGNRPLVATVYNPTDAWWPVYPYPVMAPYVDAFAPMVYWGCRDPGEDVAKAIERLGPLAPVVPAGQAYNMAPEGGRPGHPTADETLRFLHTAKINDAVGAAFWVWQDAAPHQWEAIAQYPW